MSGIFGIHSTHFCVHCSTVGDGWPIHWCHISSYQIPLVRLEVQLVVRLPIGLDF